MPSRVILAVGPDPRSRRGLQPARQLAAMGDRPLEVVRIVASHEDVDQVEAEVRRLVRSVMDEASVSVSVHVERGNDPAAAVAALVGSDDTLVVATRGTVFGPDGFVGSMAEAIVAAVEPPVVVIGPTCDVDAPFDVDMVVVTTDGGADDRAVARIGAWWAGLLDVRLWLVSIMGDLDPSGARVERLRHLQQIGCELRSSAMDVDWHVATGADVPEAVERWASRSLIVAATEGRVGLARIANPSIAATMCAQSRRAMVLTSRIHDH